MISPTRTLQAAGEIPLDLEAVVEALATAFEVVTGTRNLVLRRRLDTFDRRLQAADLTLEHQILAPGQRLVLGRSDRSPTGSTSSDSSGLSVSAVDVVPVQDLQWPSLADALPIGPVQEAIAAVVGIRALLVVSEERRQSQQLQLRNQDGKTVARVEIDAPASAGGRPTQLVVRQLLGYDRAARRAESLLSGIGVSPVEQGEDVKLGPAVRRTGTERGEPAQLLLAAALGEFSEAMRVNLPGLLDDVDTEFLHDFRVAVRRTRATLKLGRPALPEIMGQRWEPAFKWLGDATTPVRDLDVYELELPMMTQWLVKADPADLDPLARHLRSRRTVARRALVRALTSARFHQLVTDWDQELTRLVDVPQDAGMSAGELAERGISRAYRRVARGGSAIEAESAAEDLHDLRKRCKELRYALEVFAPVIDKVARKRVVADLKGLQDSLGRFQDTEVQREALRGFAEEMMAAGTTAGALLAMGELIGHLDVEQERGRQGFDRAFARFMRPSSRELMGRLGVGA